MGFFLMGEEGFPADAGFSIVILWGLPTASCEFISCIAAILFYGFQLGDNRVVAGRLFAVPGGAGIACPEEIFVIQIRSSRNIVFIKRTVLVDKEVEAACFPAPEFQLPVLHFGAENDGEVKQLVISEFAREFGLHGFKKANLFFFVAKSILLHSLSQQHAAAVQRTEAAGYFLMQYWFFSTGPQFVPHAFPQPTVFIRDGRHSFKKRGSQQASPGHTH
jgi:hypothetical protein